MILRWFSNSDCLSEWASGDSTVHQVEDIPLADKWEEGPDTLDIYQSYSTIFIKQPDRTDLQHVDDIRDCGPISSKKESNNFKVPDDAHSEKQPEW